MFLGEKPKRGCLTCTCPVQGALRPSPHGRLAGPEGGREAGSVCKLQAQRLLEPHPRPCSGGTLGAAPVVGVGGDVTASPRAAAAAAAWQSPSADTHCSTGARRRGEVPQRPLFFSPSGEGAGPPP